MIIFDDYEYVKLLMEGKAPKCIYRNNVLRSCAKLIERGDYEYSEVMDALHKYTKFDVDDELLSQYVEAKGKTAPIKPHLITFGLGEIRAVNNLRKKSEKKLYLYQLFIFKYFGTHRVRLSMREFKRLANLEPTHYKIEDMHLGHGITMRREKHYIGDPTINKVIADYSTNKPYTYYYPIAKPGKAVFSYLYEGDCFMLPSIPFESNLSELWAKYRQAVDEWL